MKRTVLSSPGMNRLQVLKTSVRIVTICRCLCLSLLFASAAVAQEPAPTFTEFEAPDAGTASFEGTRALTINTSGEVAGYYYDSGDVAHGFVRATSGAITEFSVSGTGVNTYGGQLNDAGTIAGNYTDDAGVHHGYVRSSSGSIIEFSVSTAGTAPVRELNVAA
jgi:hypothetical protein